MLDPSNQPARWYDAALYQSDSYAHDVELYRTVRRYYHDNERARLALVALSTVLGDDHPMLADLERELAQTIK
jgi:hypothetical protein